METSKSYENFPARIVVMSNLVSLLIYFITGFIMYQAGLIFLLLFLIYILALEFRLIRYHCVNCYYYGKICGFGKGKISSWFFKKGDNLKFCAGEFTWKDMIPDILLSLIPLITGLVLIFIKFDPVLLAALILLLALTTFVTGYIRGNLTCLYCKQRESGCPANDLFNKKTENINQP
jgi:hypothetical protein